MSETGMNDVKAGGGSISGCTFIYKRNHRAQVAPIKRRVTVPPGVKTVYQVRWCARGVLSDRTLYENYRNIEEEA